MHFLSTHTPPCSSRVLKLRQWPLFLWLAAARHASRGARHSMPPASPESAPATSLAASKVAYKARVRASCEAASFVVLDVCHELAVLAHDGQASPPAALDVDPVI